MAAELGLHLSQSRQETSLSVRYCSLKLLVVIFKAKITIRRVNNYKRTGTATFAFYSYCSLTNYKTVYLNRSAAATPNKRSDYKPCR